MGDWLNQIDFVCINLDTRPDRRQKIIRLFDKLGIKDRIHWWIVSKHPNGGIYGCFESHWCIWTSDEFQRPYLCVFEDDLCLVNQGSLKFRDILKYGIRNCPQKFDLINMEPDLGYINRHIGTVNHKIKSEDRKVTRVYSGFFFHLGCYFGHRKTLRNIAYRIHHWFGMDIDTALYNNARMGGCFPRLFRQDITDSDNSGWYRNLLQTCNFKHMDTTRNVDNIGDKDEYYEVDNRKNIMASSSIVGWLLTELAQFLSTFLIGRSSQPIELKDRRLYNIKQYIE